MHVVSDNQPLPDLAANSCSKCQRSVAGLIFFEVKNENAGEGGEEPPVEIVYKLLRGPLRKEFRPELCVRIFTGSKSNNWTRGCRSSGQTCNAGAPKTWRWDEGPLYIPVHSSEAEDQYGFRPYPDWNPKPKMLSSYFRSIALTEDKKECVRCTYLPMIFSATSCERARRMVIKRSTRRSVVGNPHVELRICLPCVSSVRKSYAKLLKEGESLLARFEIPRPDGVRIILDTSCALMESRVRPVTHAEKKVLLKKQERDEKRSYKKLDKKNYPYVIVTMVLPDGSPSSAPLQEEQEQSKDKKAEAVKKAGAREKRKQNKRKDRKDKNTATGGTDIVNGGEAQSTKSENENMAEEENSTDESLVVVERIKGKRYLIAQKRRVLRMKRRNNKKGMNTRYEKNTDLNAIKEEDDSTTGVEKFIDIYEELPQLVDEDDIMGITDDGAQFANSIVDPSAALERIKGKRFLIAQKRRVLRMKKRNNKKGQMKVEDVPAPPKADGTKVVTITADILKRLYAPPRNENGAGDHCSLDDSSY